MRLSGLTQLPGWAWGLLITALITIPLGVWRRAWRRSPSTRQLDFTQAHVDDLHFPRTFRWGAATAAHQAEGGLTNNNWARFEKGVRANGTPNIKTGETCGKTCDMWNLFEEDVQRMKDLGLQFYRFSIEWSRVEPRKGEFDMAALNKYHEWCVLLRKAGIEPMVTLFHFSEPLWITDKGGFTNRTVVNDFAEFVEKVVTQLQDVVDYWCTINEPQVFTMQGWVTGEFPPGKFGDYATALVVSENLLLAHAHAYHIIKRVDKIDADMDGRPSVVGIVKNWVIYKPRRWWNPLDVFLAHHVSNYFNTSFMQALTTGKTFLQLTLENLHAHHPILVDTLDFIGLNHYFHYYVGVTPQPPFVTVGFEDEAANIPRNDMGWDLTPQTLYDSLVAIGKYGKPIIITENGTCDSAVPDERRKKYLLECVYAVQEAIRDKVADVCGYIYWSLLDNFEWNSGFQPRFGLYRVDYTTQARMLTEGGRLYQRIIAAHQASK